MFVCLCLIADAFVLFSFMFENILSKGMDLFDQMSELYDKATNATGVNNAIKETPQLTRELEQVANEYNRMVTDFEAHR